MRTNAPDSDIAAADSQKRVPSDETQKLQSIPQEALQMVLETPLPLPSTSDAPTKKIHKKNSLVKVNKQDEASQIVLETPLPLPSTSDIPTKKALKKNSSVKVNKRDVDSNRMLEERCRQLCLSLFFREHNPVRSLGFTSSIQGEGKSFLALVTARILAHDSINPVTLVECNWEHPTLHEYFGIPATPGLAEWLRGECDEEGIRYQVEPNLTVIPAGVCLQDAVKLLKQVQRHGLLKILGQSNELFIVELPPIMTTGYGTLAAGLPESIVVVVRSQVTPDSTVVKTCMQLKDVPVHGIILNQVKSQIPQWIQQLL